MEVRKGSITRTIDPRLLDEYKEKGYAPFKDIVPAEEKKAKKTK